MANLLVVAGAGFAASFVDGALGMGFGPTSSTILMASGLPPKASSATVNLAKVAVGLTAGVSHWRFGNINRRLVIALAVPGCLGAFGGATLLNSVDGKQLRPWLALLLVLVGVRMLVRFRRPVQPSPAGDTAHAGRGVALAGLLGGCTNGLVGAWGPVVTPYLLHKGVAPRTAVGSVNTAEIAVAAASAGSLITLISSGALDVGVVVAMLLGGMIAAPVAAWSLRFVAPQAMGLAVSGLLLLTNVGPAGKLLGFGRFGSRPELITLAIIVAVAATSGVGRSRKADPTAGVEATLEDQIIGASPDIAIG